MTRRPSYRYKCDFCGKTSGSGGHMARHEKHCTMNPQRVCRVNGEHTPDLPALIAALGCGDKDGVRRLWEAAPREGCPACMLAAIRQSGLQRQPQPIGKDKEGWVLYDDGVYVDWDYRAANRDYHQEPEHHDPVMGPAREEGGCDVYYG